MAGMKGKLGMLAAMAMMMGDTGFIAPLKKDRKEIDFIPKQPPIPKGAKVYYFDEVGNCLYDVNHETAVFKCIAINKNSAKKKFDKFITNK